MKKNSFHFTRGVKTLVFSADAAEEKLYSELRVNGNLKKVLKILKIFKRSKILNTQNHL